MCDQCKHHHDDRCEPSLGAMLLFWTVMAFTYIMEFLHRPFVRDRRG